MKRTIDATNRVTRAATCGLMLIVMLLAGCETPTGYKESGGLHNRHGWQVKSMGGDEYSVIAHGNMHTSAERTADIAMLRSAELTLEHGRSHFEVFESESVHRSQDVINQVAYYTGGITVFVPVGAKQSSEPIAVVLIRLLPEGSEPGPQGVDANLVVAELSGKFN